MQHMAERLVKHDISVTISPASSEVNLAPEVFSGCHSKTLHGVAVGTGGKTQRIGISGSTQHPLCAQSVMRVLRLPFIDYEVIYSANSFPPQIWLLNSDKFSRHLIFHPDGSALPQDSEVSGHTQLHYHVQDYENCADILRHEKTVYLLFNGPGPESEKRSSHLRADPRHVRTRCGYSDERMTSCTTRARDPNWLEKTVYISKGIRCLRLI